MLVREVLCRPKRALYQREKPFFRSWRALSRPKRSLCWLERSLFFQEKNLLRSTKGPLRPRGALQDRQRPSFCLKGPPSAREGLVLALENPCQPAKALCQSERAFFWFKEAFFWSQRTLFPFKRSMFWPEKGLFMLKRALPADYGPLPTKSILSA